VAEALAEAPERLVAAAFADGLAAAVVGDGDGLGTALGVLVLYCCEGYKTGTCKVTEPPAWVEAVTVTKVPGAVGMLGTVTATSAGPTFVSALAAASIWPVTSAAEVDGESMEPFTATVTTVAASPPLTTAPSRAPGASLADATMRKFCNLTTAWVFGSVIVAETPSLAS
jgi:hypothetical protein